MDRAHRQRIQITCSNRNKSMDDVKIYRKRAADIVSEHCSSTQEAAFVSRLVRISDHIVNQIELPATEQMSLKTAAASNKVLITTKMLLPDRKQTSLEKKTFLQNGRSTKPKEHTMLKYDNRDHGFVLKLADYLSPNAELGKHVVILIHMMVVGNAGWVKSCSASGHLNPDTLMHSVFSSMIMKKYGVSPERVWKIEVTSTGGSGRCYYHDKHNRKKDFQFGNFLAREIFTPTVNTTVMQQMITMANQHGLQQYQQYIESYFGEMEEAFRQFAHLLVPDDVGKALMDPKCWDGINFSMASTVVTDNVSRMHNHRDPKSCLPALLCCSDPFKNGTFDGGIFL